MGGVGRVIHRFPWLGYENFFLLSSLITYNCDFPKIKKTIPFGKLERGAKHKKWVASCMLIQSLWDLFFSKPD